MTRSWLYHVGVAGAYSALTALFMAVAAWPIYQSPSLVWVVVFGAVLGAGVVSIGMARGWGAFTLTGLVLAFIFTAAPITMGVVPLRNYLSNTVDAVAAVGVGWKDLLTLNLPVGTYQAVMVPAYVVSMGVSALGVALILRGGRFRPLAALPALAPAVFGTVFGSSHTSPALQVGPFNLAAPREVGVWVVTFAAAATWIGLTSSRARRHALRRGRQSTRNLDGHGDLRRRRRFQAVTAAVIVTAGVVVALVLSPLVGSNARVVPRDRVEPELLMHSQVSPLSGYRVWKHNDLYTTPLFTVTGEDPPPRLTLAVLDYYDGIDFTVSPPDGGDKFTRFPSGNPEPDMSPVRIDIAEGYSDIWVPVATPLGQRPQFLGPRAPLLEDTFYLNRTTGTALAVGDGAGLQPGDGFTTLMSTTPAPTLESGPVEDAPLIEAETYPELFAWLDHNNISPSAQGLVTAVDALRSRGYLSHSLEMGDQQPRWLAALQDGQDFRFFPSSGGHNSARVEEVFAALNEQDSLLPASAPDEERVAAIGDDEQFATAAALIARALGYDSRVVIGVRLGGDDDGVDGVPACQSVCQGRHIAAWVEVKGADGQWAALDASPQVSAQPHMLHSGQKLPEFATQPEHRDATEGEPPVGLSDRDSTDASEDPTRAQDSPSQLLGRIAGALGIAVLIGAVFAYTPIVKAVRRRRRRHAPSPEAKVLGAWAELVDHFRDSGHDAPANAGRVEVARSLGVTTLRIPTTVDAAVYSHEGVGQDQAHQTWRDVQATIDHHRGGMTRWKRVATLYSRRSFAAGSHPRMQEVSP